MGDHQATQHEERDAVGEEVSEPAVEERGPDDPEESVEVPGVDAVAFEAVVQRHLVDELHEPHQRQGANEEHQARSSPVRSEGGAFDRVRHRAQRRTRRRARRCTQGCCSALAGQETGVEQEIVPERMALPSVLLSSDQNAGLRSATHSVAAAMAKPSLLMFGIDDGRS